jgi:hypothetical protein
MSLMARTGSAHRRTTEPPTRPVLPHDPDLQQPRTRNDGASITGPLHRKDADA